VADREPTAANVSGEVAMHVAALDSLETILFGDCWRRSRDEIEARAEALRGVEEAARQLVRRDIKIEVVALCEANLLAALAALKADRA
jgi:hypothetical protein